MRMPEPERRNDEVITSRIRGACRDGFDVATPHLVAIAPRNRNRLVALQPDA